MTDPTLKIVKPNNFLEKFKSKRPPDIGGVETLLTALPILKIGEVGDFARLHPSCRCRSRAPNATCCT